jgi:hypothetical protein
MEINVCPAALHEERKRDPEWVRAHWTFGGVWDDGCAVLEFWTCSCGSTLTLPGVGPAAFDEDDRVAA